MKTLGLFQAGGPTSYGRVRKRLRGLVTSWTSAMAYGSAMREETVGVYTNGERSHISTSLASCIAPEIHRAAARA